MVPADDGLPEEAREPAIVVVAPPTGVTHFVIRLPAAWAVRADPATGRRSVRLRPGGYGLKTRFDRLRQCGLLTIVEMVSACGVSINTIDHWRERGLIRAGTP